MTIWCMRTACWITKATDIYSEKVILIGFPLQQWLRERAIMLRYMYTAYPVLVTSEFLTRGKCWQQTLTHIPISTASPPRRPQYQ